MSAESAAEASPVPEQQAEAVEDAQLTSTANDNVVPEVAASAGDVAPTDAQPVPMDTSEAKEAAQEGAAGPAESASAATTAADPAEVEPAASTGAAAEDKPAQTPATANGQAHAAEEPDFMKEPPHGAEVFVGGVPRGASEEQIKQYSTKVGEVHSCSLVKEPGNTGQNRGYGFVKFMTKEAANRAMQELHQTEMPEFPNMKLRFQPSQSKNKLYLGNIPKDMMKDAIRAKLNEHVKGVVDVEVVMSKEQPGTGRGFCFVEFYNHSAAAHAKGVFGSENFQLGERTLTVSYAEPKQSEMNQDQVKSVYVGNLPAGAKEDALKQYFVELEVGEVQKVVIPNKKPDKDHPDYGFVHFTDRSSAVKLVEECEASSDPRLFEFPKESGNWLQIKMARPQVSAQQQTTGQFGGQGGARGGFSGRGGRGGRGYNQGYGYNQYGGGYDASGYGSAAAGYGYDANGGYGYGGYSQYAGMQMMPMMMPNGQVGYVMQPGASGGGAYGADRGYGSRGRSRGGGAAGGYGGGNQRYTPY